MAMNESALEKKVTKKDLVKVWWRSLFIMSTINYERFQSMGYAYSMIPVLKKIVHNKRGYV